MSPDNFHSTVLNRPPNSHDCDGPATGEIAASLRSWEAGAAKIIAAPAEVRSLGNLVQAGRIAEAEVIDVALGRLLVEPETIQHRQGVGVVQILKVRIEVRP